MTNDLFEHLHHMKRFVPEEIAEEIDKVISSELELHPIKGHEKEWLDVLNMIEMKLDHIRNLIDRG